MVPPAEEKTPFKIDKGNRCVKCGKEIERSRRPPYCPDCRRSRPPMRRRALFRQLPIPDRLEPGIKARTYLFFVGVVFVAIGLICVVLVIEPEARRSLSEEVGFGLPRIIWAALGGAGFTLAIGLFYAAVSGRVEGKWIRRLIKLLATEVPDMR
jgi:hypothetical protein